MNRNCIWCQLDKLYPGQYKSVCHCNCSPLIALQLLTSHFIAAAHLSFHRSCSPLLSLQLLTSYFIAPAHLSFHCSCSPLISLQLLTSHFIAAAHLLFHCTCHGTTRPPLRGGKAPPLFFKGPPFNLQRGGRRPPPLILHDFSNFSSFIRKISPNFFILIFAISISDNRHNTYYNV